MALFLPVEFAKITGKTKAHVSMGVKRGQIIMSGDYIDTTIQQNLNVKEK